jgi:hypothetical protein
MALEGPPGAIGLMFRIKMQHYSCDVAPVSACRIRVEQAQICDDVFLVVNGQYRIGGRGVGDIGIKRRLLHGLSQQVVDQPILLWARWHNDGHEAVNTDCRSVILRMEQKPLAVDHLAVLRDRHVDAGAAVGFGQWF